MRLKIYQITNSQRRVSWDRKDSKISFHSETLRNRQRLFVSDSMDIDEIAVIEGRGFKDIFGSTDGDYGKGKRIIKLSYGKRNIYKKYHCSHDIIGIHDFVGLSYNSLRELCESTEDIKNLNTIEVSKGSPFIYDVIHLGWINWMAISSFIISIIGLVLSITNL